jgi:hypothetical protein
VAKLARRARRCIGLLAVLGAGALLPAAARAADYGIATASGYEPSAQFAYCTAGTVPCPRRALGGYWARPDFTKLRRTLPMRYARFALPYNALYDYDPSTRQCRFSPAYVAGPGRAAWSELIYELQAAQADGLTPVLALTNGIPGYGDPELPDPSYGGGPAKPFAGWTIAGFDYECGIYGMMHWLTGNRSGLGPDPVRDWEPWNEPDAVPEYNGARAGACAVEPNPCGATSDPISGATYNPNGYLCGAPRLPFQHGAATDCGPLEAAELWVLAEAVNQQDFTPYGFKLAAGAISHAESALYEQHYIVQLTYTLSCYPGYYPSCAIGIVWPRVWAAHDYDDPSSGRANVGGDISSFTQTLLRWWEPGQEVWITEAGINLTGSLSRDANGSSVCGGQTFAACQSGNTEAQAIGARTFLQLADYGNTEAITQIDWYEFQPDNPSNGWDSGLLSPGRGTVASPDGAYAVPRPSLCVLEHVSPASCRASHVDASAWSVRGG